MVGSDDHRRPRALPGLRRRHQNLAGFFQVSVSKTFPIGVGDLFSAFVQAPQRNQWLERGMLKVRTAQKDKSIRFDFRDGTSRVVAYFHPKDRNKTTATVQHEKLPDAGAVDQMRVMSEEHPGEVGEGASSLKGVRRAFTGREPCSVRPATEPSGSR